MATTDSGPVAATHPGGVFRRACSWRGRIGRLEYALVLVASAAALFVGVVVLSSPLLTPIGTPAAFVWIAVCMYVSFCAAVRRIHDLDWPTPMVGLAACVPGLNIVIGIALVVLPGHPSATAHGPVPTAVGR